MIRLRKPISALFALILLCATVLLAAPECRLGSPRLSAESRPEAQGPAPSVIMFIGDGMGFGHIEAGRVAAATAGRSLTVDSMPVRSRVRTLSYADYITDSAAAATAMATGHKTINSFVGVDSEMQPVTTILEAVREAGGLTALVTNGAITGATTGAFAAHVDDRQSEHEIAAALVSTRPDVMFGGGYANFAPSLSENEESAIERAMQAGYRVVRTVEGLVSASTLPLLGLFAEADFRFAADRDPVAEPSLAQMTARAIELLTGEAAMGRNFFLLVENDLIDAASHEHDVERMVSEVLELDDAVSVGLEFARSHGNTLVLVVADHDTGAVELLADGQVRFGSDDHTAQLVPLFAEGPGQERFSVDSIDNTEIARIMAEVIGVKVGDPVVAP